MAGIVAKHRYQMKFCNSHVTLNIFNLYMRRFFFGLVYISFKPKCCCFDRYNLLKFMKMVKCLPEFEYFYCSLEK